MKSHTGFMARTMGLPGVLGVVALLLTLSARAEEVQQPRISQSVAIEAELSAAEQEQRLDGATVAEEPALIRWGNRTENAATDETLAAHPTGSHHFHIYDAWSELSRDDDGDGFFHRFSVTFDADVDSGTAHVYARLYLSYEGGPWNHYFTTETFHIQDDVSYDDYTVVTRLLDGYPAGYYDVLIELYDADDDDHVASYGPNDDTALRALPLEDEARDYDGPNSISYGSGSWDGLSLLVLSLAGLLVLWRKRKAD